MSFGKVSDASQRQIHRGLSPRLGGIRISIIRMLSDFLVGAPDIRPEEARDAKATAEQVVRRVLDWLQKFPPA